MELDNAPVIVLILVIVLRESFNLIKSLNHKPEKNGTEGYILREMARTIQHIARVIDRMEQRTNGKPKRRKGPGMDSEY